MSATAGRPEPALAAVRPGEERQEQLLGIGAAAERAGVSQRALRYYQQIGLLTPCGCTPGGLRASMVAPVATTGPVRCRSCTRAAG